MAILCSISAVESVIVYSTLHSSAIEKQIWDISCDPKLGYLRREDFYVAMRLIATAQVRAEDSVAMKPLAVVVKPRMYI